MALYQSRWNKEAESKNVLFVIEGKEVRCNVKSFSRNGSKSPQMDLILWKSKWRTPYEQKKLKIEWTGIGLLRIMYCMINLSNLVYTRNPLLDLFPPGNFDYDGKITFNA